LLSLPDAGRWSLPPVPPYKSRSREVKRLKMKTRDLSLVAIFAALYVALVYIFSSTSYLPQQFRVAGMLRPAIAKKWILAIGYALGVVIGNLFSPFVGPWELLFMPLMSLVAGLLGHILARRFSQNYFICGAVIATIIPLSLSWMFLQLFNEPILASFPLLLIGEQAVCFIGSLLFKAIETRSKWWQIK
jgi:uncharacterized membrane protein